MFPVRNFVKRCRPALLALAVPALAVAGVAVAVPAQADPGVVTIQVGGDGAITAMAGGDGHRIDPAAAGGELPIRVVTSYTFNGVTTSDASSVAGATGPVRIDVTVQNITGKLERVNADIDGRAVSHEVLVATPMSVAAGVELPGIAPEAVRTPQAGGEGIATNGVVAVNDRGTTTVQWAGLTGVGSTTSLLHFTLVVEAQDFVTPVINIATQPGFGINPDSRKQCEETLLVSQTIRTLQESADILADSGTALEDARAMLANAGGSIGSRTIRDLEMSRGRIENSAQSVSSTLESLESRLNSLFASTGSTMSSSLAETTATVRTLLGNPDAPRPRIDINPDTCEINFGLEEDLPATPSPAAPSPAAPSPGEGPSAPASPAPSPSASAGTGAAPSPWPTLPNGDPSPRPTASSIPMATLSPAPKPSGPAAGDDLPTVTNPEEVIPAGGVYGVINGLSARLEALSATTTRCQEHILSDLDSILGPQNPSPEDCANPAVATTLTCTVLSAHHDLNELSNQVRSEGEELVTQLRGGSQHKNLDTVEQLDGALRSVNTLAKDLQIYQHEGRLPQPEPTPGLSPSFPPRPGTEPSGSPEPSAGTEPSGTPEPSAAPTAEPSTGPSTGAPHEIPPETVDSSAPMTPYIDELKKRFDAALKLVDTLDKEFARVNAEAGKAFERNQAQDKRLTEITESMCIDAGLTREVGSEEPIANPKLDKKAVREVVRDLTGAECPHTAGMIGNRAGKYRQSVRFLGQETRDHITSIMEASQSVSGENQPEAIAGLAQLRESLTQSQQILTDLDAERARLDDQRKDRTAQLAQMVDELNKNIATTVDIYADLAPLARDVVGELDAFAAELDGFVGKSKTRTDETGTTNRDRLYTGVSTARDRTERSSSAIFDSVSNQLTVFSENLRNTGSSAVRSTTGLITDANNTLDAETNQLMDENSATVSTTSRNAITNSDAVSALIMQDLVNVLADIGTNTPGGGGLLGAMKTSEGHLGIADAKLSDSTATTTTIQSGYRSALGADAFGAARLRASLARLEQLPTLPASGNAEIGMYSFHVIPAEEEK
ncbi:hypothetical protein [Actinotignum timonense]|uniref:Uncharacterized protein n=2 Tax=Actinotignum timonense TaxID=1870995 RepID=A0ABU5GCG5_9ACTO|nr:hypothetical protein [Actinotignum timonense]MDY5146166.1 hypothetical protein [Actinotignum timonense]